ncbi:hypothetical protein COLO4_05057 [Corchorus olitorius]|uniref:F-box associated domain-containing protein n=1 Tax=Corchorus olitorius TaxID=93759 RepID=A0A1R3KS34_9ROSI|nr:hypothetical protein COLO4_05057 [Corchorus olitorius]
MFFLLLNSLTGEYHFPRQPYKYPYHPSVNKAGFGYDSTTKDFKIIMFNHGNEVQVFSLRNNRWTKSAIEEPPLIHSLSDKGEELILNVPNNKDMKLMGLGVLDGCLTAAYCEGKRQDDFGNYCEYFGIWMMKGDGVAQSWTKLIHLDYHDHIYCIFPICYTKKGRVLLLHVNGDELLFNLQDGSYRKLSFQDSPLCPPAKYVITGFDTLISPNSI